MSREERLQKCNKCHALFCKVYPGLEEIRKRYKKSFHIVDKIDKVMCQLEDFL